MFGGKTQSTTDQRLNAIQVNQSAYGNCVPLVYGRTRIPMTLGWYGSFTATPHTQKQGGGKGGGGGGGNTTFTYSAALIGILCEGQINAVGIGTIWSDKEQRTLSDLGFTLFTGAGGQAVWSYLTTNFPSQAIPYDHTAYVAAGNFQLGGSAGLPNLTFEVYGLNAGSAYNYDAEASNILIDYCTDANHGAGFSFLDSGLQGVGVTTYESYCIAMGFFFSPAETQQRAAVDFIKELAQMTNSAPVWSPGIGLRMVPYADASVTGNGRTYTPDLTPLFAFTDDDYCPQEGEEPVQVDRRAPSETYNIIRIEFLNRSNQYNTDIAEAKDENDIRFNGERPMQTINLHAITSKDVARQIAQLILQRQLYVRNEYTFRVRADYSLLEAMDLVSITDSGLGISNKLVRIIETDDDEEDFFTIVAEEVLVGTASAPLYDWQAAQGYAANYFVSPGSIQTPLIFAVPPLLVDANGGYELAIAVTGLNANWGGCDVYWSTDNVNFFRVGRIAGSARYGTLRSTFASGTDPDTTNTLQLQLTNTNLQLVSASATDADNLSTLMYVDGEFIAYSAVTLVGTGQYNLGTRIRRGKYGSTIASHASGTSWARFDDALFRIRIDPGRIGQTLYFKFPSHNIYGGAQEDISTISSYSKVLALANGGQNLPGNATFVARGNCVIVGDKIFKGGGSAAYDSDCYSIEAYSGGCVVKFRCATDGRFLAGLNSDPLTDQNYTSLDFCWYAENATGHAIIYESGTAANGGASFGNYTSSTVFSITYDGNVVRYYLDGVLKREVAAPGKVFFFDSSFNTPGSTLTDLYFGALNSQATSRLIARGNCIVVGNSIQKPNGSAGTWDSDCYSAESFPGGCQLSFRAADTNQSVFMLGLNSDPTTDQNYTSLDYAWYIAGPQTGPGRLLIYKDGSSLVDFGGSQYTSATVFSIKYDGQWVRFYRDGALMLERFDPGKTFFMDSSFRDTPSTALDVSFGQLTSATPSPFIARGNCKVSDANVIKEGGSANWDSDVYSIVGYPTCHVSFKSNQDTGYLMVGLNTDPTADSNYTSLDYAFYAAAGGVYDIRESGSAITSGNYTTSTVFAITYDGSNVRYYVDGVLIRTVAVAGLTLFMDSSFYQPGCGVNSLRFGPTTNLAVADTAQIGDHAATDVTLSTLTTQDVGFSPTAVITINMPTAKFAYTAIVTAIFDLNVNSGSFGGAAFIYSPTYSSGTGNANVTATQGKLRCSAQKEYAVAVGDTPTFQLFANSADTVGTHLTISEASLQVEAIKK
ncbi:MAG TPA: phage tail protein [Burkholderiales bacterium]|nr:phage tail protein [Burkholderiales bacterium]